MGNEPSATAQDLFKKFLEIEIHPFLKSKGFSRQGQTSFKWVGKNCEVVNFQANRYNTREDCKFTVNLGVFNRRIFQFETEYKPVPENPKEYDCHWRERLNSLLPDRPPEWWAINKDTQLSVLGYGIRSGLEVHALPVIDRYVTDEGLRDFWMDKGERIHLKALLQLAVLLAEIGPAGQMDRTLQACRKKMTGTSSDRFAGEYIARIEALRRKD